MCVFGAKKDTFNPHTDNPLDIIWEQLPLPENRHSVKILPSWDLLNNLVTLSATHTESQQALAMLPRCPKLLLTISSQNQFHKLPPLEIFASLVIVSLF